MAVSTLTEAEKMRRVPGVFFADGLSGRRARIAGTGIEVFEAIKIYRECDEDRNRFSKALHWLSDEQVNAALTYAREFPDEIDARLRREDQIEREAFEAHQRYTNDR